MRSLQFSKKAEYACVAMVELAARHGDHEPVSLKTIADAHDISPRFLVQILLQLKGTGLVVSTRGSTGGYQLGRAPGRISLADIIGVIDRSDTPQAPRSAPEGSPANRAVLGVWKQAQIAQQRLLEQTTLADLVRRMREGDALVYQI